MGDEENLALLDAVGHQIYRFTQHEDAYVLDQQFGVPLQNRIKVKHGQTVAPIAVLGRETASLLNTYLKFAPEPRGAVAYELHAIPELEALASGAAISDAIMPGAGSSRDGSSAARAGGAVSTQFVPAAPRQPVHRRTSQAGYPSCSGRCLDASRTRASQRLSGSVD